MVSDIQYNLAYILAFWASQVQRFSSKCLTRQMASEISCISPKNFTEIKDNLNYLRIGIFWGVVVLLWCADGRKDNRSWIQDEVNIFNRGIHADVIVYILGSLRIDDLFHDDDVCIAESPTTHVQKGVAQDWASSRGRRRRNFPFRKPFSQII